MSSEDLHPNGTNSAPNEEHWNIRRWTATELTAVKPVALIWHARRANTCGTGVTGAIHINGTKFDSRSLPAVDPGRICPVVLRDLAPGDIVDLVLTPVSGGGDRADGCDGSANWRADRSKAACRADRPDGAIPSRPTLPIPTPTGLPIPGEYLRPGNLALLTETGDNDRDGSTDSQEQQRSDGTGRRRLG